MTHIPTPGELAYIEDLRRRPTYDTGERRPAWAALEAYANNHGSATLRPANGLRPTPTCQP